MILVDTSVWIDHFHQTDNHLVSLLANDLVGCHIAVIEELALGSIKNRAQTIAGLELLPTFPHVSHAELLNLVDWNRLWGRGLSVIDAHLLASTRIVGGARLWTRDKRLAAAAEELGIRYAV